MSNESKLRAMLGDTKLGRQSTVYSAAIECLRQTSNVRQAGALLAKKFIDKNPWAAEMIGIANIEKYALAYVQKRYAEMGGARGQMISAQEGQVTGAPRPAQDPTWSQADIRPSPQGKAETARRNSRKTAFDSTKLGRAQAVVRESAADSILRTLRTSDGKLVATMALSQLRSYENDGILAKILLDKVRSKFSNPDPTKVITEFLNENEIRMCAAATSEIKAQRRLT